MHRIPGRIVSGGQTGVDGAQFEKLCGLLGQAKGLTQAAVDATL